MRGPRWRVSGLYQEYRQVRGQARTGNLSESCLGLTPAGDPVNAGDQQGGVVLVLEDISLALIPLPAV